jgi:hypothetical protein
LKRVRINFGFVEGRTEPQVPPLRFASVGMTRGGRCLLVGTVRSDGQKENRRHPSASTAGRDRRDDKFVEELRVLFLLGFADDAQVG